MQTVTDVSRRRRLEQFEIGPSAPAFLRPAKMSRHLPGSRDGQPCDADDENDEGNEQGIRQAL